MFHVYSTRLVPNRSIAAQGHCPAPHPSCVVQTFINPCPTRYAETLCPPSQTPKKKQNKTTIMSSCKPPKIHPPARRSNVIKIPHVPPQLLIDIYFPLPFLPSLPLRRLRHQPTTTSSPKKPRLDRRIIHHTNRPHHYSRRPHSHRRLQNPPWRRPPCGARRDGPARHDGRGGGIVVAGGGRQEHGRGSGGAGGGGLDADWGGGGVSVEEVGELAGVGGGGDERAGGDVVVVVVVKGGSGGGGGGEDVFEAVVGGGGFDLDGGGEAGLFFEFWEGGGLAGVGWKGGGGGGGGRTALGLGGGGEGSLVGGVGQFFDGEGTVWLLKRRDGVFEFGFDLGLFSCLGVVDRFHGCA